MKFSLPLLTVVALSSICQARASSNNWRHNERNLRSHGKNKKHHLKSGATSFKLCAQVMSNVSNDKYFWLMTVKDATTTEASCLLKIPAGTKGSDTKCCIAKSQTAYDNTQDFIVIDPATITSPSNPLYQYCGKDGGEACQNYNYDVNEAGFESFRVKDADTGGDLSDMHRFMHKKDQGCGTTSKSGHLCFGKPEYSHAHVGKGYCLKAGITLSSAASGCSASGWDCLDSDC